MICSWLCSLNLWVWYAAGKAWLLGSIAGLSHCYTGHGWDTDTDISSALSDNAWSLDRQACPRPT